MTNRNAQIAELKAAIKTLEVQRPILGNLAVDSALEGLHLRLKELEEKSSVPSQVDGERRQATILFSDLSGYTAMSEYLDPEEVEEIMNRIKEAAIRIIESYEGTVNQFIGDEVVSLFGIPNAHEDDPSRAVKAALELHLMVRQMSGDLKSRINHALTMHSGINTGLIVTTSRDDRDGKFGLTGDTVNTGARILALAKEDEILVGTETQRLIAPYFKTESMEPAYMKGKAESMIPHRILGVTGIQTRIEVAEQRGFTSYTGRDEELATLNACLEKTLQGEGQFVTVKGEAGMGKSRLLYEFRHNLDRSKINIVQGRCQSYGAYTPYLPFLDALRKGLKIGDRDTPTELHEKVVNGILKIDPTLEKYLPVYLHLLSISSNQYPLPTELSGEKLKQTIQEASVAINVLNAKHQPMVLILEDWHWVDEASDATLIKHFETMNDYPLMVIVNFRPEYSPKWSDLDFHTSIDLESINERNTGSIIRTIYGVNHLPEGMTEKIFQRTGGNPFFVEELCDLLKEQKTVTLHTVESREKQLTLQRPLEQITFPESVQAVIRTRLDRLGPEQKEVLRLASVIGREFSLRVLEQIITDKEMLPSSLEKLKLQDLIRQLQRLPEVINQFNHVITQEVTYETLLIKQRVSLHRLVAEAIELIYSERLEEQVEVLAYHYRNSNHVEKTIQYLELAGDKSSGFFSLADARGFYQEAIELIDRFELTSSRKEKRIDLNIKLASVSGYAPSAWNLNCLKTSLDYAEQLNDLSRKVKIKYWLGRVYFSFGNYTEAKHQLESCIEVSDILDEQEVSVLAQNLIGRICWFGGDYQNGIIHLEKWIPLLERFNNPTDANYSLGFLGGMYGLTGNFTKSTEILEKAINQTIELKDINREAVTTWYQALIMAIQGNWQKSIEFCDQAIRLSVSQISNTLIKAGSLLIKGDCLFMLGEVDEGLELMQEGVQIMESIGSSLAMSYFYAWYAEKMSKVGRLQESEELVKKSLELDRFGERWGTPLAYRALASIYLQTDDFPKASSALAQSIQTAIDRGARPDLAIARYHNAQLFLKREDILQAQEQLTQAIELFREMGMTWWLDLARQLEAILVESSNGDESSLDSSVIYD